MAIIIETCPSCGWSHSKQEEVVRIPFGGNSLKMRDATKEEQESINKYIKSISEPVFTKNQLKQFYEVLSKMSFKVDLGYTGTEAVRLVEVEDILINQFK